jgi:hypothetical protein
LREVERRLTKRKGTKSVTDSALAKELGVTQPALVNYRGKAVTARQVVNLMEKFARAAEDRLVEETLVPLVEFFPLQPIQTDSGKSWRIFSQVDGSGGAHPYLKGLQERLAASHGIYIFHDSRGRAIYAGKAQRLSLWDEMNNAFNRNRGEVQSIKRTQHPKSHVQYKGPEEKKRQIFRMDVALHDIAHYMTAYQVPARLIGKFEALIVRSFANDLLNVRMEKF